MLQSLSVKNYALIDHLEITLDSSLNIITGETGAGKSILLGALGLLLGAKNDGKATRDNSLNCIIEGTFLIDSLNLKPLFEVNDWEYDEEITLRRVITPAGKSRAFIGDIPVSLSALKILGAMLIDIHSQHQNQIVSNESYRIMALDLLYDSTPLIAEYRVDYDRLQQLQSELRRVEEIAASAKRDEEWLTYQVEELTAAKLRLGEVEEAEAELRLLENAEQIGETLSHFVELLDGDNDHAILVALHNTAKEMQQIGKDYPAALEYGERVASILEELKDMNSSISAEVESIEADPERLDKLSARIDTIYSLCQKHRARDLAELIEIRDRYTEQLSTILGSDEQIAALQADIERCEKAVRNTAAKITKGRKSAAPQLSKGICATLARLGMEHSRFEVDITPAKLSMQGGDRVTFLFSSVEGKSPQPVECIASGGELSRVMLSLKALLSQRVEMPTIIFDEIDTGVSGRIADAMGEIIAELSNTMQVIDITHLPQVASKGSSHFVVYKEQGHTQIAKLTPEERVQQIATMISGSTITNAALEQAKILLG